MTARGGRLPGMEPRLAVYGTLRDAAVRRRLGLEGRVRPSGHCRIPGRLYDLGDYPALRLEPDGPGVVGHLLTLDDPGVLATLDAYEGFRPDAPGSLFTRRRVDLEAPAVTAWVYVYARAVTGAEPVPDGDWWRR